MEQKLIMLESKVHALEELLTVSETSFLAETRNLEDANRKLEETNVKLHGEIKEHERLECDIRQILDASGDAIKVVDKEYNIIYVNDAFLKLKEIKTDNVRGRKCHEIAPEEECFTENCHLKQVLKNGEKIEKETSVQFRSGAKALYLVSASPYSDAAGVPVGVIITYRDITGRKRAEDALRESEERYRGIIENVPIGMFQSTPEGKFIYVNPAIAAMLGYASPEELIQTVNQTSIADVIYENPAQRQFLLDQVEPRKGNWRIFESRYRRKDGQIIQTVLSFCKLADPKTGQNLLLGFLQDVTERKLAEEALKKSEARFRSYFESSIAGIAITSPAKGWVEINDRLCDMLGYSREELRQKNWVELTHPDDLNLDLERFNLVLSGEIDGYSIDKRFICKNGETLWTSLSVQCVRLTDGSVDYILALLFDITERKHAEEKIRHISAIQNLILENSTLGIALVRNRVFEWTNARVGELLMLPLEQIQGSLTRVIYPSDGIYEKLEEMAYPILARGERSDNTLQLKRSDGALFWCRFIGKALNPAKPDDGSIWIFEDVTEERQAKKIAEENAVQQGRIEMANNMMHDIGNALTGISACAVVKPQTEKDWPEIKSLQKLNKLFVSREKEFADIFGGEKEKDLVRFIEALTASFQSRNSQYIDFCEKIFRTFGHISSILELHKYYLKEKITPLATVLNIRKLIEDALIILTGSLQKRNIAVKISTDGSNPHISGDQTRLMRMFLNIIKNTYDAFDNFKLPDGRKMEINIASELESSEVKIEFSDNGAGFSQETGNKLFERGFSTKKNGSGIGLHECRAIVESHGGTITIESKGENAGSKTVIKIPFLNNNQRQEEHGTAF